MELSTLEAIRYNNAIRQARSQEWIGGMFFMIAYGMVQFTVGIAIFMSYVLPLRRFGGMLPALENQKVVTGIYTFILAGLFFLVSTTAGMSGFVVMGGLLVLWAILLLLIGCIRRCIHKSKEKKKIREAQEMDDFFGNTEVDKNKASSDLYKPQVAFATPERGVSLQNKDSKDIEESASLGAFGANASSGVFGEHAEEKDFDVGSGEGRRGSGVGLNSSNGRSKNDLSISRSQLVQKSKRRMRGLNRWTYCPERVSGGQVACFISSILLLMLVLVILCVFALDNSGNTWTVQEYQLINQQGESIVEYQPPITAKALQFMYAFPKVATQLKLQLYVKLFTEWCGTQFNAPLADGAKEADIKVNWIDKYNINMSIFDPSDYKQYTSVNEWFVRAVRPQYRPLPLGQEFLVSPADCRLLIYTNPADMAIWLKGHVIAYNDLLNNRLISGSSRYFDNGAVVIARLAPQDYHRFHSPLTGTIVAIEQIANTYWSVSADGARSGNDAFLNTRTVVILDCGPRIGFVAYVAIGATCVGSVRIEGSNGRELSVGSVVERGEQLGSMNFGGSTVVMLFAQGRVLFDERVVMRSRYSVETYVDVRESIGSTR